MKKLSENRAFQAMLDYPRLEIKVKYQHGEINKKIIKEANELLPEALVKNEQDDIIFQGNSFVLFSRVERICRRAQCQYVDELKTLENITETQNSNEK